MLGCDDDEPTEDYTYDEDDDNDEEGDKEGSGNNPSGFVVTAVSCRGRCLYTCFDKD